MKKMLLRGIQKMDCSRTGYLIPLQSYKLTAGVFLCSALIGCELTVDIHVPFEKQQLVLNSFFHPDSVWSATLSANQHILDSLPVKRIENATIVLYDRGAPVDTLIHVGDGVYRSDTSRPVSGHSYEMRATAPDYNEVVAFSHVPVPTSITAVEISQAVSDDGYPEAMFTIRFTDDLFAVNYYQVYLEYERDYLGPEGQIRSTRFHLPISSNDPTVQERDIYYDGLVTKDIFFQNGSGVVSITAPINNISASNVIVAVRTLSEEYYRYRTTGSLQENTSENPFTQPVNVFSNVEHGFGIFAGFTVTRHFLSEPSPRPVVTSIVPQTGAVGDTIHIYGENLVVPPEYFSSVAFKNLYGFRHAYPVQLSPTEIKVVVPGDALTGKIFVDNGTKIAASEMVFEVIE